MKLDPLKSVLVGAGHFECSIPLGHLNPLFLSNRILIGNLCPDLTNWYDNIPSKTTRKIMNTQQMRPRPMTEDQLEHVKKEIIQIYFFLISKTGHDPMIVEVMKLSALADLQKRYETGEPWLTD